MADFREKGVLMACREAASSLGYQTLKEEQLDVTSFVKGKDVLAVLPTGIGKSLCYARSSGGFSTVCTVLEVQ